MKNRLRCRYFRDSRSLEVVLRRKPVGTVWIAAGYKNEIHTYKQETNRGRSHEH